SSPIPDLERGLKALKSKVGILHAEDPPLFSWAQTSPAWPGSLRLPASATLDLRELKFFNLRRYPATGLGVQQCSARGCASPHHRPVHHVLGRQQPRQLSEQ